MAKNRKKKSGIEWTTVRRRVNDLLPFDKNPRVINEKQMSDLQRSLTKFNLAELPAINTDGKICAGHQRIKALQLLGRGEEMIEVRIPNRKLTEKEFKDYLLTSNRSGGSFDWEMLKTDFDIEELLTAGFDTNDFDRIFDDCLSTEDDSWKAGEEIEKAKKTTIKSGDYFALGRHRLLCGNSLDPKTVQRLMGKAKADVVNDDVPFNIGLSYDKGVGGSGRYGGTTNDSKSDVEYRTFVKTIMQNALSVTKPDAHIFFYCDERYVYLFQELYKELGIDSKRLCIWLKSNSSPTPALAFNKVTEFVVYGTRGKPYLNNKVNNLNEIMNKEVTSGNRLHDDIADLLNIWLVKRLASNEMEHPTQKSPTIHEKALRRCSKPGDIVLDLTAGSGSILIACEQLKRAAYVAELEPIFCQVIINRFKKLNPNEKITKLN
jgi:DNA modification methylase